MSNVTGVISRVATASRPLRRRLTPRQFKETYIREFLADRPGAVYVEIGAQTGESFREVRAKRKIEPESVDLALVGGRHEFRQALRDVLHLEPYMRRDGLIVVDGCNPMTRDRAEDTIRSGTWNGDVWKVISFLRDHRSDLTCVTIDADQGVGLVTGFHGRAPDPDPAVVDNVKALDYSTLESYRSDVLGLMRPAPLRQVLAGAPDLPRRRGFV